MIYGTRLYEATFITIAACVSDLVQTWFIKPIIHRMLNTVDVSLVWTQTDESKVLLSTDVRTLPLRSHRDGFIQREHINY